MTRPIDHGKSGLHGEGHGWRGGEGPRGEMRWSRARKQEAPSLEIWDGVSLAEGRREGCPDRRGNRKKQAAVWQIKYRYFPKIM